MFTSAQKVFRAAKIVFFGESRGKILKLFPLERVNQVVDVFADKADDGLHRVVVGLEVEIEGAADEVFRAIGEVELHRCGHALAVHLDEEAVNLVFFVDNQAVAHAVGFLQVLDYHGVHVFKVFAKVTVYGLVRQVDGAFELRHLNIDPILFVGRIWVGGDKGVLWAFEAVSFDGVDAAVGLLGQVDAEIAARLGQVTRLAVAREGDARQSDSYYRDN